IFSGGAMNENDEGLLSEAQAIREGGGFGSIVGRNAFQRAEEHAVRLLGQMMEIYGAPRL
ncbi:MAG: fructose-bisphosphate aldolase, partial [Chloroflexota bacterium]|nr:fructose-bisphosphate aldolase [Chloroflexota bacterium]